jgi:hypothetical protein
VTSAPAADPLAALARLADVVAAVGASRTAVDGLLAHRVLRRRSADVSIESALRGAWASAVLDGAEVTLAEMRAGAAAANPVAQGALRAQSAIGALADTWTRAPRQALARLHALAAADLLPQEQLGRPTGGAVVASRLDTLAHVLAATSAPAVLIAAVVHGEVLGLDAFAPVSGIVARAAVRLTLIERGLDPKSLVTVEVGHLEQRAAYDAALAAYRTGSAAGVAAWVAHCGGAVVAGAVETTAICEAIQRG